VSGTTLQDAHCIRCRTFAALTVGRCAGRAGEVFLGDSAFLVSFGWRNVTK